MPRDPKLIEKIHNMLSTVTDGTNDSHNLKSHS